MIERPEYDLDTPPIVPEAEEKPAENPPFASVCALKSAELAKEWRIELGPPLLTHSAKWGFVWRADFKRCYPQMENTVNRLTIWRAPNGKTVIGIADAQQIPPLYPPEESE